MSLLSRLLELVGDSDDEHDPYQCIRCGRTFEREHYECPACGVPHAVVRTTDAGTSGQDT
ncbi:hypothetical protein [Halorussus aquaticus]|uniref:Uncharacterized protein n=1 Tax=Halorussus aquaticus TaxID=2953748 RepID=A0ABD5Q843_9EURY|nr:hypothetical protein [Halorussus aquaticus]